MGCCGIKKSSQIPLYRISFLFSDIRIQTSNLSSSYSVASSSSWIHLRSFRMKKTAGSLQIIMLIQKRVIDGVTKRRASLVKSATRLTSLDILRLFHLNPALILADPSILIAFCLFDLVADILQVRREITQPCW